MIVKLHPGNSEGEDCPGGIRIKLMMIMNNREIFSFLRMFFSSLNEYDYC